MSMSTMSSGSGRVDDIQSHPQGEIRGWTKLFNVTEDVRKYAAEQQLSNDQALHAGMEQKAREFKDDDAQVHTNA